MNKTRMYLDVDGCINAFAPSSFTASWLAEHSVGYAAVTDKDSGELIRTFTIKWYHDMIEALKELDVELVWCTTWRHDAPSSIGSLVGFGVGDKVLHPISGRTTFPSIHWKTDAIIKDQQENPSKFIWVDDELRYGGLPFIMTEELGDVDALVIAPDPYEGISKTNVKEMQDFIEKAD